MNLAEDFQNIKTFSKEFGWNRSFKRYFYNIPSVRYRRICERLPYTKGLKRVVYKNSLWLFRLFRDRYVNLIYNFYNEIARPIIERYNSTDFPEAEADSSKNIWVCWWQGAESMPWLCRMCFDNLIKNVPEGYDVRLVSRDNYQDFVEMPSYILDRLYKGTLSITQFSDILREALLYYQGGLWVDASVWTTPGFYQYISQNNEFWSIKLDHVYKEYMTGQVVSDCMWSGFFMYGKKGNIVTKFAFDCMCEYFEKYTLTFDYFLQNYFIKIGYNNIYRIKECIDSIPHTNSHLYGMWLVLNRPFDPKYWDELLSDTGVFKLSQKVEYKDEFEGKTTFHGHIKELYNCMKNVK